MENIEKYLTFCEKYLGVEKGDQFQTVDLYEKQNMYAVSKQNLIAMHKINSLVCLTCQLLFSLYYINFCFSVNVTVPTKFYFKIIRHKTTPYMA